jgi:hypothetical protein
MDPLEWGRFYLDRATMTRHERPTPSSGVRASIASAAARLMARTALPIITTPSARRPASWVCRTCRLSGQRRGRGRVARLSQLYQEEEHAELIRRHAPDGARICWNCWPTFNPYLTGSVLDGTAGEHSQIDILLFADSAKEVEIFLLNRGIDIRACRTAQRACRSRAGAWKRIPPTPIW